MKAKNLLFFIIIFLSFNSKSQSTFQKQYEQVDSAAALQTLDSKQTPDGGYVITGNASEGTDMNKMHPFVIKFNCKGEKLWENYFGLTQSNGNIYAKIIITKDSGIVIINNLGSYFNYNGFIVKLDNNGNILWQKLLNLTSSNDNVNDIIETSNGELLLACSEQTTSDVGLVKLSSTGNFMWNKYFGNTGNYDDGYSLIQTSDGNYLIAGRYISMGTFNALLFKTDTSGTPLWLKCYGDTLQNMTAYDVKEFANGDILMVGSTTLLKPNFQSFSDNFITRLNSVGDTIWTKIFYGNPDSYENISSVELDKNENIIVAVATASYNSPGIIPNKHALMKFSPSGNLLVAKTYNTGSSHYPRISKNIDGTILMGGFSNLYASPVGFQTLLLKMDSTFSTGCFENDVKANTIVTSIPYKITTPTYIPHIGGSMTNNISTFSTSIKDTTFCQNFPQPKAIIQSANFCIVSPTNFSLDTTGLTYWHWNFGDSTTTNDTSLHAITNYQYSLSGNYTVQLIVSNGCDVDTAYQLISIKSPVSNFTIGEDKTICLGDSITVSFSVAGLNYLWSTNDTTQSINIKNAGTYYVLVNTEGCGYLTDTMKLTTINCDTVTVDCQILLPNAFTPNGDKMNDELKPILVGTQNNNFEFIKMEVFNRWGNAVFVSNDVNKGWDGKINGIEQSNDSYYFFIKYRCNGNDKILKGDVLLLR